MPGKTPDLNCLESDVDAIRQKFGPFAEVYAESRSEAAAAAVGNEAGEEHWRNVADIAEETDQ